MSGEKEYSVKNRRVYAGGLTRLSANSLAPDSLPAATILRCSMCWVSKVLSSDKTSHASPSFATAARAHTCRILSSRRLWCIGGQQPRSGVYLQRNLLQESD